MSRTKKRNSLASLKGGKKAAETAENGIFPFEMASKTFSCSEGLI